MEILAFYKLIKKVRSDIIERKNFSCGYVSASFKR